MTKSSTRFFGYTQRMPGTVFQQWMLSPLPIPTHTQFVSTQTGDVATNAFIPVSGTSINQVGGVVNSDGTFSIPAGLYKIYFQTTVTGTAEVVIGLTAGGNSILKVTEPIGTDTISGEIITSCSGCDVRWGIRNESTDSVATEMMGSYSINVIVEKLA